MKFGNYVQTQQNPEWAGQYLDYKALKDLIKASAKEAEASGAASYSPRTTSLSVVRASQQADAAEEKFFQRLEQEVDKVGKFTQRLVTSMRDDLKQLGTRVEKATDEEKEQMLREAKKVGEDYLALEKFVNLNYMGFHKILKKHDKSLPHAPCRQFYIAHLHQQPWVQGTYSDLLVSLSRVHSLLRGDVSGQKNEDSAQGFVRSTTKYWVRTEHVSLVKHHILQHMPVFQFDTNKFSGDAQLINSVYFDNDICELYHGRLDKKPNAIALRIRWYGNGEPSLVFVERKTHRESWKGEESVKERFSLKEDKIIRFLNGEYSVEEAMKDLRTAGKGDAEVEKFKEMFIEVWKQVDSKQLLPFIRTQYMRSAFQIPFDSTVRISLDTNLVMIKENPEVGPTCLMQGRWYRNPALPVSHTEITRFPHAVLEVKLSLPDGEISPPWVQELLESGYLIEIHKFSKFIHGTATLFPELVQAVPYWIDDESVRPSILMSAPAHAQAAHMALDMKPIAEENGEDIDIESNQVKPRKRIPGLEDMQHPLLGDKPTLKVMPGKDDVQGFRTRSLIDAARTRKPGFLERIFYGTYMGQNKGPAMMKIEPKTFFANERTFLSWLHMSVTIGSIAAAMLGFAGSTSGSGEPMSRHLVAIISLILLPLSIAMCCYALATFVWRAKLIQLKKSGAFDDRLGPLGLCGAVVTALTSILIICIVDMVELMTTPPSS